MCLQGPLQTIHIIISLILYEISMSTFTLKDCPQTVFLSNINNSLFLNNKTIFSSIKARRKIFGHKGSQMLSTFVFVHLGIVGNNLHSFKSFEALSFAWIGGEGNSSGQLESLGGQLHSNDKLDILSSIWQNPWERPQGNINWHQEERENKFIECTSNSSTTHE